MVSISNRTWTADDPDRGVPIWVPDPGDPDGLEGSWQLVEPGSPGVDPRRAAQASLIARLWATAQRGGAAA